MHNVTRMDPEFDRYAEDYDAALNQGLAVSGERKEYFAERRVRWLASRLRGRNARPTAVLDFGCGTGAAMSFLRQAFPEARLVGTDLSTRSLDTARRQQEATGAEFEPFPDYQPEGAFDLAHCNGVFHHIPVAERAAACGYLFRALVPGGWFALWENNPWNPGTRLVMRRIPFDRDAVTLTPPESRAMLQAAGFDVVRTDALFLFPRSLGWLRFMEPWFAGWPLGAQYLVLARKPETPIGA